MATQCDTAEEESQVKIADEMEEAEGGEEGGEAAATALKGGGSWRGRGLHCYSPHSPRNIFGWKWRRRRGGEEEEERATSTAPPSPRGERGGGGGASSELIMQDLYRAVIIPSAAAVIFLLLLLPFASAAPQQTAAAAEEEEDFSAQVEAAATAAEAAGALRKLENCFLLAAESTWPRVLAHNETSASLALDLLSAGPDVMGCLTRQRKFEEDERKGHPMLAYKLDLARDQDGERFIQSSLQASLPRLLASTNDGTPSREIEFHFLVFPGEYRVRFNLCQVDDGGGGDGGGGLSMMCKEDGEDNENDFFTGVVASLDRSLVSPDCVTAPVPGAEGGGDTAIETTWVAESKSIRGGKNGLAFTLFYPPCLSADAPFFPVLPYEEVSLTLIASENDTVPCEVGKDNSTWLVASSRARVRPNQAGNLSKAAYDAGILPERDGRTFYCLVAAQVGNPLCSGGSGGDGGEDAPLPEFCRMSSPWSSVDPAPLIARYLPFCRGHFDCAWLYLTAALSAVLVLSFLLAACCVYCKCCANCCTCCCNRCRRKKSPSARRRRASLRLDDGIPFDCLNNDPSAANSLRPKKTWAELHQEWDVEPPKNPGKILLLYSPDSKLFRDLQGAFKSFLELACHCVVLDLFDDELFQTIAFDPEQWLTNLMQDPDFKIIVICSKGAFKRQQAILSKEVLNIPDNSTMDGLFSAGLRFIQSQHAYDYSRLGLARYETLSCTGPEYRLQQAAPSLPSREFLVPTGLHDLFCWIHGYDPLDLLGKPWDRYHLELQLLTDALKQARMEKRD